MSSFLVNHLILCIRTLSVSFIIIIIISHIYSNWKDALK